MAQSTFSSEAVANHIVAWLKAYLDASGMDGWVVGVSGGIDSAVTSTLCAMTGAPTTCVKCPFTRLLTRFRVQPITSPR